MVRKRPVHLGEEQMMFARKLIDQQFQRRPGSAVSGVPANPQPVQASPVDASEPLDQPGNIGGKHFPPLVASASVSPVPDAGQPAKLLNVRPEKRPAHEYHLEGIVIGGIVAAGYLNAALYIFG